MQIDTRDCSVKAVDASLAASYDVRLPYKTQRQVHEHLAYLLTQYREPNTYITPCREAMRVMDARFSARKSWYERPVGIVFLAAVAGLLVLFAGYKLRINGTDAPLSPAPATTQSKVK